METSHCHEEVACSYLPLKEFHPFAVRTKNKEVAVTVWQRYNLFVYKLGAELADTLIFFLEVVDMHGEMMHLALGRQVVVIPMNDFQFGFIRVAKSEKSQLDNAVGVGDFPFQFETDDRLIKIDALFKILDYDPDMINPLVCHLPDNPISFWNNDTIIKSNHSRLSSL